jgi:adenylate cyclase
MEPIRSREAAAAVGIALMAGFLATAPALDLLRGLSLDALTALRWHLVGARYEPASSPTVVIAFDEASYRMPPFKGSPTVTWTREIARVVSAIINGGARVVGFDVIFPTSIEESEIPFGAETLGARMRGFDRDFLRALAVPARAGKIVLGEILGGDQPIEPAAGQRIAVGHQRNIRALNVYSDADEVVRRVPLMLTIDGRPVPTMAVELAARAMGIEPEVAAGQGLALAGYRIPTAVPNTMTLNFEGGTNDIPTYSLVDLRACVESGNAEFFRRHFDGKVVLVGSALDFEDRRLTSKRFATTPAAAAAERCVLPPPAPTAFVRNTIGGVYIHATAVNNLLRRDAVTELGRIPSGLIVTGAAVLAGFAALTLAPMVAVLSFLVLALAWTAAATVAFGKALALPLFEPFLAGALALAATTGFRLVVTDRDKRFLRKSFALYLAPAVIEKMVSASKLPQLGGETRIITVFFSDVVGFSSFFETMTPAEIVVVMNRYLSAMSDTIEQHGGFVDKYVGDAIVAVFGAPVEVASHAADAVRAALCCGERLAQLNREAEASGTQVLGHRIGLNSGRALIGNIGSHRRFNYTVIGDSVNLASRLESANKYFGTSVLASEMTMKLAGDRFAWREIDTIRVKGRTQPVKIYEPLAEAGHATPAQVAQAESYARGLAAWRRHDFSDAADDFARLAATDPPSAMFLARAKKLASVPPGPAWEPINTLEDT